ncbi:MAG: hypothetical protein JWP27_2213 [Flaviaesturariibacter sp.]|nr:hypothetical protein [Flaviaesturariibacter sp.]
MVLLFISVFSQQLIGIQIIKISIHNDRDFRIHALLGALCLLVFGPPAWHNSKQVAVDPVNRLVTIRIPFARLQTFRLEELDGMFRSSIRRGKGNAAYEVIYLMKQGKVIAYIDELFCSNISAVRLSLKYMHNLGFQKMTLGKRLNVILGLPIKVS